MSYCVGTQQGGWIKGSGKNEERNERKRDQLVGCLGSWSYHLGLLQYCIMDRFSCPEGRFLTLYAVMCSPVFQTPLEMGQRALEVLGGLDHAATIHPHFRTSFLNLCWIVLWLSPEARMFFIEKCCPRSTWSLLQPHFILFHSVLLATILVCCYQQSLLHPQHLTIGV